jgi:hypothetical protein
MSNNNVLLIKKYLLKIEYIYITHEKNIDM